MRQTWENKNTQHASVRQSEPRWRKCISSFPEPQTWLDFDETLVCLDVLKSPDLTFAALCQVLFCWFSDLKEKWLSCLFNLWLTTTDINKDWTTALLDLSFVLHWCLVDDFDSRWWCQWFCSGIFRTHWSFTVFKKLNTTQAVCKVLQENSLTKPKPKTCWKTVTWRISEQC